MAAFSQDKIRRIVSDMEHKSWKRKNNTGVPEEVIHHPGAGVEVPLLHFPLLEKTGIVKEGFTTRLGGVSEGIFSTMNLSFTRGDEEEAVRENYRRLASALDVDYDKFVFTDQTHTTNVRKVTAEDAGNGLTREREFHDIDGLITDVPGIVFNVLCGLCSAVFCRSGALRHRVKPFRLAWDSKPHGKSDYRGDAEGIRKQTGGTALCDRTVHLSGLLRGERGCCGGV